MNVNLNIDNGDGEGCSLLGDVTEHLIIIKQGLGWEFTGRQVLIPEGDEHPGSFQVWNETIDDTWIYITPDGESVASSDPLAMSKDVNHRG